MNFEYFISKLIEELKKSLPGQESQMKMIPKGRRTNISYSENKNIKKSAVLILLFPEKDDIYIVLIKRATDGSKHSGQIALPGGKFENEDCDLFKTAVREAEEEIGVKRKDVDVIGHLTSLFIPVSNYFVQPVVGRINYKPEFIRSINEVDEIYTVKLQELKEAYTVCKTFNINGKQLTAPFYIINDIKVWGATAMILSEFIEVLNRYE